MMSDFAAAAVAMARELNVTLDYSEASLEEVEQILAQLHGELNHPQVAALDAPAPRPTAAQMDDLCRLWGSYVGEVVRRRWGGEWGLEQYPGRDFATLALTVGGSKIFPSLKVYRRLTDGDQENLWSFYQQVRARLAAHPGNQVQ